jgi:lipid A disaccharide synthetase
MLNNKANTILGAGAEVLTSQGKLNVSVLIEVLDALLQALNIVRDAVQKALN